MPAWKVSFVVFFLAPLLAAQEPMVKGRVTGPQGNGLPQATVQVVDRDHVLGQAISGSDGSFQITLAGTGDFVLKVEAPGFRTVEEPVSVALTGNAEITVQMADSSTAPQLAGTVVDASGAVIAGASVMVRSADGIVKRLTETDTNGSFGVSGLSAGNYQLVVSSPGFATKEMPVTIGTAEEPAALRISLAVSAVSTTVKVQGREDSLIGIADSATQGTVGATEIEDRPILRSGEILETVPGLIITQHAGGGKANQYFLRGFNLDHGTDFAVFLDGMPLNLPSHAHGEGYADMNTVIPEFVQRLNYEKGPYYADVGNYSSAGSANLHVLQDAAPELLPWWKAACMALAGRFRGFAKARLG